MDDKTVENAKVGTGVNAITNASGQRQKGEPGSHGRFRSLLIPLLAILTALIIGALVIIFTDESVYAAFGEGIGRGIGQSFFVIGRAYGAFFVGAFGNPVKIVTALFSGKASQIYRAIYPLTETLRISTPYIFAGLAVALGFQGGLFNIGAEGQYFIAGLTSVFVAYSIKGLPGFVHLPLALLAGMAGGALWGAIPGYLKATKSSTRS